MKNISELTYSSVEKGSTFDKTYQALCTEYYELSKPNASSDALNYYLNCVAQAEGPVLEPMCGTGRFFIPILSKGYNITGFDTSKYMLDICRKKCVQQGLTTQLLNSSFESFSSNLVYQLIFIPSGSFCLLTEDKQRNHALTVIAKYLGNNGKFIFEIDTIKSINKSQNKWRQDSIHKSDGSKLVLNTLSNFDPVSRVENTLSRYELWKNNTIIKTETEDFRVRLYQMTEIEKLLKQYNFIVVDKYRPYTKQEPDEEDTAVLYECIKYED